VIGRDAVQRAFHNWFTADGRLTLPAGDVRDKTQTERDDLKGTKQDEEAECCDWTNDSSPAYGGRQADDRTGPYNKRHGDFDWRKVSCDDSRPTEQEQPDRDHERQPKNETRYRCPLRDLPVLKPCHDWEPQWQGLHFVPQRSRRYTHGADDVQSQQRSERRVSNRPCVRHGRIIRREWRTFEGGKQ